MDFKQQFYAIHSKGEELQWGELIKDILSLANGNIGYAAQPGYLVIGPEDKPDSLGNRKLYSTEGTDVNISQIQDKVNSACRPSIPVIELNRLEVDGSQILIIFIGPSPYLHETTRDIKTGGMQYHKGAILIRIGDKVKIASAEEVSAIRSEKDIAFNINRMQSDIEKRINNIQKELNKKQGDYDNIRSKLDIDFKDHDYLYNLRCAIDFDNLLINFLKMKKKLELEIHSNHEQISLSMSYKCFDYAVKLIKEKIPKLPLDYIHSIQLINDINDDAMDKLEMAIENGCRKPSAYYYLIKIYDSKKEPLSAFGWVKDSVDIEHEFVALSQLNIKVSHEVKDLYEDYSEEATDCIEIERKRLRGIFKVDIDEWGQPING